MPWLVNTLWWAFMISLGLTGFGLVSGLLIAWTLIDLIFVRNVE